MVSNEDVYYLKSKLNLNKKKDIELYDFCKLIAIDGFSISEAVKTINVSLRAMQIRLKRRTSGQIKLKDLKWVYKLNHPEILYSQLTKRNPKRREYLPLQVRYNILVRDKFKCKICGISSDKAMLHIDHIIPVSKGGTNDFNNLRTLCAFCNLGKKNTDEELW